MAANLTGAKFFKCDMNSFESKGDENGEKVSDSAMETEAEAEKKRKNVARRKKRPQLPSDDDPVPESGYFDGGPKCGRSGKSRNYH